MNLQSIILLSVILLVAAIVAYRYIRRQKRNGCCGSCNCNCNCSNMCKTVIPVLIAFASTSAIAQQSALIPYPQTIHVSNTRPYILKITLQISAPDNLANEAAYLATLISQRCNTTVTHNGKSVITLRIDPSLTKNREQYTMSVTHKGITLSGASDHAVFNAINTLDQWMLANITTTKQGVCIPAVEIQDTPRYGYRALMLDPARHFIPIHAIKRYIDEMARFKFNILQLHLADDQGFRIQILSHPQLTQGQEHYTQDEIRDLITYAATRHISIVPEIDIPGHTYAILRIHPEYLCQNIDTTAWGRHLRTDVMLCASVPSVYELCNDILGELCTLFPSPYIHIGGDESLISKNWGQCPRCQGLKAQLGYTSDDQIMGYFFSHFWDMLRTKGKKPIMWVEMDNIRPPATRYLFQYPQDVTLVTWRNAMTPKAIQLTAESGNQLIMAPGEHCYFDYPQYKGDLPETNNWGMPILTLQNSYQWNPSYPQLNQPNDHIIGVMGTLWGEAISDINRAFYMTYPRALALAEAGWSIPDNRQWDSFKTRIYPILSDQMQRGIPFRVPFEITK